MGRNCHYWRYLDYVVMRQLRLFLYFIVGILLSFASIISFAAGTQNILATRSGIFAGGSKISEADANCSGHGKLTMGGNGAPGIGKPVMPGQDNGSIVTGTYAYCYDGYTYNYVDVCPSGTVSITQVSGIWYCQGQFDPCASKAGWYDNGGNPQMVQLPGSSWYEGKGSSVPETMCIDGCTAGMKQNLQTQVTGGGYWGAETNPLYTGQSCSTSTPTDKRMPKDSDEKKCVDSGKAFGYVNDKVLCVTPDEKGGTATKKTETKNADGTTTKTETTTNISCNAQGACSTTTTTTTTVINSDGTTASTKTETKKEETGGGSGTGTAETSSFCKDNPSSPMCKSGTFSGTCAQEPECTGDPVQCATAKAAFKTKCALEASQEVAAKGQALMDGTDQEVKDALARKEINVSQITTSDSGGGSCPADRAVSVGDRVVMIPYSSVCGGMAMMKIAMLAIASFIAAMILIGGVK